MRVIGKVKNVGRALMPQHKYRVELIRRYLCKTKKSPNYMRTVEQVSMSKTVGSFKEAIDTAENWGAVGFSVGDDKPAPKVVALARALYKCRDKRYDRIQIMPVRE